MMTKDETIRELSDKIAEVEFNYARLLKAHNRLKVKHKNLECRYEELNRENHGLKQTNRNLNEKLEAHYRCIR